MLVLYSTLLQKNGKYSTLLEYLSNDTLTTLALRALAGRISLFHLKEREKKIE